MIRLTLGLVDAEEQKLLAEFARKAESHEQKMRDRPKLEFTVEREKKSLEDKLGLKVESPDAPLLQQEVDKKVTQLRNESDQALASVKQNEEIDKLIAEVGQRRAEWNVVNAMVEEAEETFDLEDARLRGVPPPPKKPKDPLRETLNGLGPFRGYCSHPMDKAWKANCPIAHERPADDEITDTTKKLAANSQSEAAKVASLKAELERRRKLAAPKQQALQTAAGALTMARERHQKELEKLKAPAQEAARIEAVLASYRKACADLAAWDVEIKMLKRDKESLDAKLSDLTKHHQKLLAQFGDIFNFVAQRMLGKAVTGRVRFSGKMIVPELEYHGLRDSAALKVVRWLIFDLASLALGITNTAAHHPRFLMHDSPREADLAASIYVSLFNAAQELEAAGGKAPAFQYIVTTTEPPPDLLNRKPWVIDPILDASSENGRLLGVDI